MLIKLAWRNLWRNKMRTSIMLGAMVFGLLGVSLMMGFMTGLVDSMLKNAISWQTSHVQVHQKTYVDNPEINSVIPNSDLILDYIKQSPDIKAYSARVLANGMVASARSTRGVRINGIDLVQEQKITPLSEHIVDGKWLSAEGRNPVLVSQKIAERLRLRVGSKVVLTFSDTNNDVSGAAFRVRGIFKTPSTSFDDGNVYVRKNDLTKLAGIKGVHEIAILVNDTEVDSVKAFQQELQSHLNESMRKEGSSQISVRNWQQVQPLLATMQGSMKTSNQVMLAIFVIAMGFGIINILLMSVFERTQEFGVLMAVGMQKHKIFILIMLESTFLGVTGAALGVISSFTLMTVLGHSGINLAMMAEALGNYGMDTMLYPYVAGSDYQMIFVTVVLVSLIAALYPARQILKQHPVQAMSEKH
ncbi:ABC transporter permease [Vibrio tapetis]|uniref:Putative ABC-type antimicrobial peptide transport system, permease component n=1 Tax=Vibrio tapetis subsp. tapetis TaxID=1671868 RepID=A0A2N8ZA10_9VIBR|nr:FtsX-like permease family protein [Vibrio tapetis]SON48727.1 putative ABC-type antimicrobial peptide transport system, permease component [Vibrio tapetis subsp. tapetis]